MKRRGETDTELRRRLRDMPTGFKAWHLVPFVMPLGLVLIFLGATGSHSWLIPVGFGLLGIFLIDLVVVFPLVMVRANRRRRGG
jgi:hypothetical protein